MPDDAAITSSQLSEFVSRTREVTERYPQMNEDNTKSKLLREFLELLGWDIAFDAELEYPVTIGTTRNYVDYALSADGSAPVLFVEAKGYDTTITDSHREQLHSYLRQTDVDWGLLANGDRYEIYRRENVDDGVTIRAVAQLSVEELPTYVEYVRLLTKDALTSGHAGELAERIFEIRRARETLERRKDEIADRLAGAVTDEVGDVVSQEATTESKELIDRLIADLEARTEHTGSTADPDTTTDSDTASGSRTTDRSERSGDAPEITDDAPATDDAPPTDAASFWDAIEDATGIRRTEDDVELREDTTAVDDFIAFIRHLFAEGYLTRADLPIASGNVRYLLNTENAHKNGDEMYMPKEIFDGVFLETHQSTADKKRKIVQMAEQVGVDGE
ncbi:type I restriction enzyme HsdR N-terminal domain-containing protein [Halopenitus sp. POP-27]|uniref:type I restriction enzyme HsdR N-terminal domain-containing protein n=1 Tax=Halopenitus sp. POP-27 TaxID=2994425 RepID=UPI002468C432|nr:type I restriction enzyme HsdR N-terminal domain-containing protein [Halopenitus sp. POP-27]